MKPMYFKLYHNPENKTLTIPRAALQLSGLADAEELILHTGGGYVLAARNALSTLECLHLLVPHLHCRISAPPAGGIQPGRGGISRV